MHNAHLERWLHSAWIAVHEKDRHASHSLPSFLHFCASAGDFGLARAMGVPVRGLSPEVRVA